MRQIPTGEYCGECPMLQVTILYHFWCNWLQNRIEGKLHIDKPKRLIECVEQQPQVMTEEERGDIFHAGMKAGYDNCLQLASEGKEVKP